MQCNRSRAWHSAAADAGPGLLLCKLHGRQRFCRQLQPQPGQGHPRAAQGGPTSGRAICHPCRGGCRPPAPRPPPGPLHGSSSQGQHAVGASFQCLPWPGRLQHVQRMVSSPAWEPTHPSSPPSCPPIRRRRPRCQQRTRLQQAGDQVRPPRQPGCRCCPQKCVAGQPATAGQQGSRHMLPCSACSQLTRVVSAHARGVHLQAGQQRCGAAHETCPQRQRRVRWQPSWWPSPAPAPTCALLGMSRLPCSISLACSAAL